PSAAITASAASRMMRRASSGVRRVRFLLVLALFFSIYNIVDSDTGPSYEREYAMTAAAIDHRLHPLTAFRAVRRLLNNPDDPTQVFIILRAMRGASITRAFKRFRTSPVGRRVMAEQRQLLAALDGGKLAALSQNTVGAI